MQENAEFDLFIAYYGNLEMGSQREAGALYSELKQRDFGIGRPLRIYFHPETNPYGSFEETPLIVARTPLLLLAVNGGIPRNAAGQLQRERGDGTLSNLFEEVRAFHDSPMFKSMNGDAAAKLFISDGLDFKTAERLHPMFSGRTALVTAEQVVRWVSHFYAEEYPARLHDVYRRMSKDHPEEFLDGSWVPQAEDQWNRIRHQGIGRSLLVYYIKKIRGGNDVFRSQAKRLYEALQRVSPMEQQTQDLLSNDSIRTLCGQ